MSEECDENTEENGRVTMVCVINYTIMSTPLNQREHLCDQMIPDQTDGQVEVVYNPQRDSSQHTPVNEQH